MIQVRAAIAFLAGMLLAWPALAADCPGNPDALGTSRTITVDPAMLARIGDMQYRISTPLGPKEVVLTFDDGPMPPMTNRVLDILQSECVKATFFLIGRNARAFSSVVQRIAQDGHTIGNHTQNHPFATMSPGRAVQEIEGGYRSIAAALQPIGMEPSPFFRFPGLKTTRPVESYLQAKGMTVMSTDFLADDWYHRITPDGILAKALNRLEARGGSGMLLLHDVKPGTALILPKLLKELKQRGYSIVHMVPAAGTAPQIAAAPDASSKAAADESPKSRTGKRWAVTAKAESSKSKKGKQRVVASAETRHVRHKPRGTATSVTEAKPAEKYWPRTIEKDLRNTQ
jgi:peptidoglycan/xylan/chitin deacetylase (PgdA/CDA1 family)